MARRGAGDAPRRALTGHRPDVSYEGSNEGALRLWRNAPFHVCVDVWYPVLARFVPAYEQDEDTELGGNTRMAQVSASANNAETMPTAASQNGGAPRAMRMSRVAMT